MTSVSSLALVQLLLPWPVFGLTGPKTDTACDVAARQARRDNEATAEELSSVIPLCFRTVESAESAGDAALALARAINLTRYADPAKAEPLQDQIVDRFVRIARGVGEVSPETYAGFARFLQECSGRRPAGRDFWREPELQRLCMLLERIEAQVTEPIVKAAAIRTRAENRLIMDRIFAGMPPDERQSLLGDLRAAQAAYGDLRVGKEPVLDDEWNRTVRELSELYPGAEVPEIIGVDLDEKPMKLSDYRGKVIVIMCWASWCPTCLTQAPRERILAKKFEGRPFVFLGLNGDRDLSDAQRTVKRHHMTWRSFWGHWKGSSGDERPLQEEWNVTMWPTVYVIDATGHIRYKYCWDTKFGELETKIEKALARAGG